MVLPISVPLRPKQIDDHECLFSGLQNFSLDEGSTKIENQLIKAI